MKTDELLELISAHFQESDNDTKKRLDKINAVKRMVDFNLRLTELSDEEKQDFVCSMESYPLTEGMRKTLEECDSAEKKDHYFEMWARSAYFRRCAWLSYLEGETPSKPSPFKSQLVA